MSVTDAVLREDPAGCYPAMDFESRDLYRHAVEDARETREDVRSHSVAPAAVIARRQTAARRSGRAAADERERVSHVGYYLVDRRGRSALETERRAIVRALAQRIARFAKPARRAGSTSARWR